MTSSRPVASRGPHADPTYRSYPADPPYVDLRQSPRRAVGVLYSRSANPTRARSDRARELDGGLACLSPPAWRRARSDPAIAARAPVVLPTTLRRHLPSSTSPLASASVHMVDQRASTRSPRRADDNALVWVETPTNRRSHHRPPVVIERSQRARGVDNTFATPVHHARSSSPDASALATKDLAPLDVVAGAAIARTRRSTSRSSSSEAVRRAGPFRCFLVPAACALAPARRRPDARLSFCWLHSACVATCSVPARRHCLLPLPSRDGRVVDASSSLACLSSASIR